MAERPERFEGVITVEWSNPPPGRVMPGWRFVLRLEDGTPLHSALAMTLHVDANDAVWAEVLALADDKGQPVISRPGVPTQVYPDDDPWGPGPGVLKKAVFAYEVAGMTVGEPS